MDDTYDVKARLANKWGLRVGEEWDVWWGGHYLGDEAHNLDAYLNHITAATRAPLEARIAELEARIFALGEAAFAGSSNMDRLEAENAGLREALAFYADGIGFTEREDNGATARAALQQKDDNQ